MAEIVLDGVTKVFDDGYEAVKDLNLDIADGEFVILVGPSGCGKSTALRMIAGLEDISSGELRIGDEVMNDRSPKDRDIAMVFQNYALYPHMTVRENMGFALSLAGVDKAEIDQKVEAAAEKLDLVKHLDRKPANLSGGQRQRVAMGRAIVRDPKVFLMDEPLSNLDAKLRVQMRTEVARLQSDLETTMVYVTHDQVEAMTLGDRVAVMKDGYLQQVDTPLNLYDRPVNLFVAGFIGSPAMNFMVAEIADGKIRLPIGEVDPSQIDGLELPQKGKVVAGIRPENFEDAEIVPDETKAERGLTFEADMDLVESLGSDLYAYFHVESEGVQSDQLADLVGERLAETGAAGMREGHEQIVARLEPTSKVKRREKAELWADTAKLHLFDPDSGERIGRGPTS
jgi:multiple sugar transport system ATP-binding protein